MTGQETTDADLIDIAVKKIRQGYKDGKLNTWQQEMAAVIAAVRPIIEAQARAEGRREVIDIIEASFEKVLNPLSGATGWQDRGVRMWFELARKDIEALDTGAAADVGEESR